jgi:hypothetical protein
MPSDPYQLHPYPKSCDEPLSHNPNLHVYLFDEGDTGQTSKRLRFYNLNHREPDMPGLGDEAIIAMVVQMLSLRFVAIHSQLSPSGGALTMN